MDAQGNELVIAVDVGGGSVKLALTNAQADELHTAVVDEVPRFDRPGLLDAIGRQAEALRDFGAAQSGRVIGTAIGVPGFLAPDRRGSRNSNVPVLDEIDLAGHFEDRLGFPVLLENDANLAALGEWSFGPSRSAARFMMLTLGTGIGVALLDKGAPVGVVGGTLGDAGHIIVDSAGTRACRLGCRGCLESVASGVALDEMAAELAERHPESPLVRGSTISGADVAHAAAAGDRGTLALLAEIGRWLGMGMASYINAFAPEVIGIGGGMSRFRPYLEAAMLSAAEEGRIKNRPGPHTIYFSADFERAASRGAATLFFGRKEARA